MDDEIAHAMVDCTAMASHRTLEWRPRDFVNQPRNIMAVGEVVAATLQPETSSTNNIYRTPPPFRSHFKKARPRQRPRYPFAWASRDQDETILVKSRDQDEIILVKGETKTETKIPRLQELSRSRQDSYTIISRARPRHHFTVSRLSRDETIISRYPTLPQTDLHSQKMKPLTFFGC